MYIYIYTCIYNLTIIYLLLSNVFSWGIKPRSSFGGSTSESIRSIRPCATCVGPQLTGRGGGAAAAKVGPDFSAFRALNSPGKTPSPFELDTFCYIYIYIYLYIYIYIYICISIIYIVILENKTNQVQHGLILLPT